MKHTLKFINLLVFALILTTSGCSKDDETETVTISLQDLEVAIDENPTNGQALGTIQSNAATTLSFTIDSQSPANALDIDTSTGELTVADATLFDYEVNTVITATISATGAVNNATVTININNVIELDAQDFTTAVDENPTNGDALGTVQATGDSALSFSITSQAPAGAVTIDVNTGELTVADATIFDFETNPIITADITVDNSGNMEVIVATININDINEVGEFKYGGVIFWVNAAGDEGYTVSMNNQSSAAPYGCIHTATGATGIAIGTGESNTATILSICSTPGTAADLASNLNVNGYDDWFLPSQNEMEEIMNNQTLINTTLANNGGEVFSIANANYWTSTEVDAATAKIYNYYNNWFPSDFKSLDRPVRAVRAWTDF